MAATYDDLVQLEPPGHPTSSRGRRTRRRRGLVAAGAVVLLGLWFIPGGAATSGTGGAGVARVLQDEAARRLADGRVRLLQLKAPQGLALARVGWKDDGTGFVDGTALPTLAGSRTYQLWALAGTRRVSVGVLGHRPGITAFSAQVAGLRGFSLTDEPASGVSSSARSPVAYGHLPPRD